MLLLLTIGGFLWGQWTVARRQKDGFLIWAGTNATVAIMQHIRGAHEIGTMFWFYCLVNYLTYKKWEKNT